MHRGYYKAWRKITDSISWSRGLEFRGLMHSILVRVNHKSIPFRGELVPAGAFAVVMSSWAEELGISRQKLQRMLKTLEGAPDSFIKIKNVGNRFSVVTVCNWGVYQSDEEADRATADTTAGQPLIQPAGNHRATTGQQNKNDKNNKKEEREKDAGARVDPPAEEPTPEPTGVPCSKKTLYPSKGRPSYRVFRSCLEVYTRGAVNEDGAWVAWCDMEDRGMLDEDVGFIRDQIIFLSQEDDQWREGFAPSFTQCIKTRAWRNKPFKRPQATDQRFPASRDGPPRATTQAQKNSQDREAMAMALLKTREAKRNAESQQRNNSHEVDGVRAELPGGHDRTGANPHPVGRLD